MKTIKTWATALAVLSSLMACDSDDKKPVYRLDITAEFPSAVSENQTGSLHFWVLEPRRAPSEDEEGVSCGKLRLRDSEPYDPRLIRQSDWVLVRADDGDTWGADIAGGTLLVYVEGVSFTGEIILNGCVEMEVSGDDSVTVSLYTAETLNCDDPEAENGTPCDDGMFCTVGETCDGNSCGGGADRDCSHLADECNAEACNETDGCHTQAKSENTPCEDGEYCTVNDACDGEGECIAGGARDCAMTLGVDADCYIGSCNEFSDTCSSSFEFPGTTCDADMSTCTPDDVCDSFGNCVADSVDCSAVDGDVLCMVGQCSVAGDACEATQPYLGLGHALCNTAGEITCGDDPADSTPSCDANQNCVGGTTTTESQANANCADGLDNDCDGEIDSADSDSDCPAV